MNTEAEVEQAFQDLRSGKFARQVGGGSTGGSGGGGRNNKQRR